MSDRKTTLERAFEMAESGRFHDVRELRRALQQEGYWDSIPQTAPRSVSRQLADIIRKNSLTQLN